MSPSSQLSSRTLSDVAEDLQSLLAATRATLSRVAKTKFSLFEKRDRAKADHLRKKLVS